MIVYVNFDMLGISYNGYAACPPTKKIAKFEADSLHSKITVQPLV